MRRFFAALALTSAMSAGVSMPAHADVAFNLSIGEPDAYYMGLGNYYGFPQTRVVAISQRGIPSYDVPVALYIASLAHVDPYLVADLRMSGMSWMQVSHYFGLGADVYYMDATPYGPYTSYYQPFLTTPRSSWVTLGLSDLAIVNLTNLRYASQYYGVPAVDVMRYRARGDNFLTINRALFQERGYLPAQPVRRTFAQPMTLPDRFRAQAREIEQRRNVRTDRRVAAREQARIEERQQTREQTRIVEQRAERRVNEKALAKRQAELAHARNAERARAQERAELAKAQGAVKKEQAQERAERAKAQGAVKKEQAQQRREQRAKEETRSRKVEMTRRSNQRTQREMASRRQMRAREMARSRQEMSAKHASRNTQKMRSNSTEAQRTKEGKAQRQRPQQKAEQGRGKHQK
jgi:hypothetical protein